MKKPHWIWLQLFGVAILTTLSASSAWAKDCGDANGPAHPTDVPCDCGDTVVSDTVLTSSDPVVNGVCFPVGLFVAGGVRLDAHFLLPPRLCRDDHPFPPAPGGIITIGLFIVGDDVTVESGDIRGCDYGIFGGTDRSTIERVTAGDGRLSFFIIGDKNELLHNACHDNHMFGGIFLIGNSNTLERNYCRDNPTGDAIALIGDDNALLNNLCHDSGVGINVIGNFNTLERNYCNHNRTDGIIVQGSFNELKHNRGQNNERHGVIVNGGDNLTDRRNYGTGNDLKPDCSIDGQTVPGTGGRYC